jgi:hypothetical protein
MSDNAPHDELAGSEQPFVQHLVELRDRLIRACLAIGVAAVALSLYPGPAALYDILAAPLIAQLTNWRDIDRDFGDFAFPSATQNFADDGFFAGLAGGALPNVGLCGARPVFT